MRRGQSKAAAMPGKRIQFDNQTYNALMQLAEDQHKTLQELVDEAFRDLLKKKGRHG
jgi:hypothetical protein